MIVRNNSRFALLAAFTTLSQVALLTPAMASSSWEPTLARAAVPAQALRLEEEWYRAIVGVDIGGAGLHVADLDGSGSAKIVASAMASEIGGHRFWYVLSHSPGGYEQEWTSLPYSDTIGGLRTAEIDGTPGDEVLVAAGGQVFAYDGATLELLHRVETPVESIEAFEVADCDGDGAMELLFCDTGLYVYDVITGEQEYHSEEYDCSEVAVGEVDGDPTAEIVLGGAHSAGAVLDGATYSLEWSYDPGFGELVRLGDLDGDGLAEIATTKGWPTLIAIYDADLRSLSWEIQGDGAVAALRLLDVEKDGRLDIVYGEDQWGSVHVWDARARELKWSIENPDSGVTDLAVGDPDDDGVNELLWGAEGGQLFVASATTQEIEWWSQDVRGPFRALDFGDVDYDGDPELLYGSNTSDRGLRDGLYFIHDARTKALEYRSGPPTGTDFIGLWRIRHANVDADPQSEIFITTSTGWTGVLICYDAVNHEEQWRWSAPGSEGLHSLDLADVDADGELEVVIGMELHLQVLDAATGREEWRSVSLGTSSGQLPYLRIADVDADPHLEMLVAQPNGRLFVHDGVTHVQELQTESLDITALETVDRDGDGTEEILIGTSFGQVAVLDCSTGTILETLGEFDFPINAFNLIDLTGDSVEDLVLAMETVRAHYLSPRGEVLVYDGRFRSELLWRSGLIGMEVGGEDSLRVDDIDDDGKIEILVSLGELGLRIYQVEGLEPCESDLPPGPYLEAPGLPSFRFKVRITAGGEELMGSREADCLGETLCVSGALPGRSELFARIIGPRPNGYLWVNLVRFTPSRVEVWVERPDSCQVNYYDLPALPREDTELTGLVDKEAFLPAGGAAGVSALPIRSRPLGTSGVVPFELGRRGTLAPGIGALPAPATFTSPAFPGYRFTVRIFAGGEEQPARVEPDCIPETVCVSGALPGRSELFLRMIGPRPNGYMWVNLVRFTTSRVEVDVEQLATGQTRAYVLEQVPRASDALPGWVDKAAFLP